MAQWKIAAKAMYAEAASMKQDNTYTPSKKVRELFDEAIKELVYHIRDREWYHFMIETNYAIQNGKTISDGMSDENKFIFEKLGKMQDEAKKAISSTLNEKRTAKDAMKTAEHWANF